MVKIFVRLLLISVFCVSIYAQEQKIIVQPLPTPPSNSTTLDIGDYLEGLEIDSSGRLTSIVKVTGKIINVHDGDTITLLDDKKQQYKVRFNGIDAPELKQDFGNRSQKSLAEMAHGKVATIEYDKIDKYGRFVCKVFVDGVDLNLEQVKRGMAWHYKKYQMEQTESDRQSYAQAEENARQKKLGLWSQPNPTEPGAWRRGENNPNLAGVPQNAIIGNINSFVYHTPGCSTYAKISPQNRIVFPNENEAIKKGYKLAGSCESTLSLESRPKISKETASRVYEKGPRGGCFYLNPAGKKIYVDKSKCQ